MRIAFGIDIELLTSGTDNRRNGPIPGSDSSSITVNTDSNTLSLNNTGIKLGRLKTANKAEFCCPKNGPSPDLANQYFGELIGFSA